MSSSNGDRSVLVVEDDQEINALVGAYVELCGFKYRPAFNGTRALEEARAETPELVVLDLMLPDLDGFEVCKRLKAAPDTQRIPVIMLTALSGEKDRERGRLCGAEDYLTKPFNPDRLMESIAQHARRNGT
jgi:DNA-binding response OmpR family regulator